MASLFGKVGDFFGKKAFFKVKDRVLDATLELDATNYRKMVKASWEALFERTGDSFPSSLTLRCEESNFLWAKVNNAPAKYKYSAPYLNVSIPSDARKATKMKVSFGYRFTLSETGHVPVPFPPRRDYTLKAKIQGNSLLREVTAGRIIEVGSVRGVKCVDWVLASPWRVYLIVLGNSEMKAMKTGNHTMYAYLPAEQKDNLDAVLELASEIYQKSCPQELMEQEKYFTIVAREDWTQRTLFVPGMVMVGKDDLNPPDPTRISGKLGTEIIKEFRKSSAAGEESV